MFHRRFSSRALLVPLLLVLPLAAAHAVTTNETFTHPTYLTSTSSGPTGNPCETYETKSRFQTWGPTPGTPAGPGAGPTHAMHTAGTPPGATGWHQVYRIDIQRTLRTDTLSTPGLCVLPIPWVSGMAFRYLAFGGGSLANPADVIDVTLRGNAQTLAQYAAQSGATLGGVCTSSFGVAPVAPTGQCVLPTVKLMGAGTHDLQFSASATGPTSMVSSTSFPAMSGIFAFDSAPTPGTGTPGGPHTDQILMTLAF